MPSLPCFRVCCRRAKTGFGIAANCASSGTRSTTRRRCRSPPSFDGTVSTISNTTNVRRRNNSRPMPIGRWQSSEGQQGFHLYTYVEGGRLLHYGWLIERQTRGEDGWVDQVYFPPPDTAVLFDHFTHPLARGRGLYLQAICRLLHDARGSRRRPPGLCHVFGSNGPSRHVIEKVGFQHAEGSLFKERRLVWSRPCVSAGGPFPTALL